MRNIDYSKLKDIKKLMKKAEGEDLTSSLVNSVINSSKTKVYLINEFDLQGKTLIVVIVRWWNGLSQAYKDSTCVWDKESAIK